MPYDWLSLGVLYGKNVLYCEEIMVILGIDPGLATIGFGVLEKDKFGRATPIDYGVILTPKEEAVPTRLAMIEESLIKLSAKENTVGFIFKGMEKQELFPSVTADGSLPRKTFSMGHANDKRFYVEARKIK